MKTRRVNVLTILTKRKFAFLNKDINYNVHQFFPNLACLSLLSFLSSSLGLPSVIPPVGAATATTAAPSIAGSKAYTEARIVSEPALRNIFFKVPNPVALVLLSAIVCETMCRNGRDAPMRHSRQSQRPMIFACSRTCPSTLRGEPSFHLFSEALVGGHRRRY